MDKEQQIEEIRTNIWHENTTLSEVCDYIIRKQQEVRKQTAKEILQLLNGHTLDNGGFTWTIDKEDLRFLAEEYGVEIEE